MAETEEEFDSKELPDVKPPAVGPPVTPPAAAAAAAAAAPSSELRLEALFWSVAILPTLQPCDNSRLTSLLEKKEIHEKRCIFKKVNNIVRLFIFWDFPLQ